MGVKVWLLGADMERLQERIDIHLEPYADFQDRDTIMQGVTQSNGVFSRLTKEFVLGKVNYWERESSKHRTPFVRIDNHPCYLDGLIMTPYSRLDAVFHTHHKTIDETTALTRVELLQAPNNDFIGRVFATYELDTFVAKPQTFTRRLIVYCDERHLVNGRV